MKRFLSLSLAVLMLLSFAACGESKIVSKKESESIDSTTEAQTINPMSEPTTITLPLHETITFGKLTDISYENEYFGFGIEVPSNWSTKPISEIATLNNTDADTIQNNFESVAGNMHAGYLFYSIDDNTGNNISVTIENLDLFNDQNMTPEKYLKTSEPLIKQVYANMGATNIDIEISTVNIGNNTYDCLSSVFNIDGEETDQLIVVIQKDHYLAVITFTILNLDTFGYLDEYFYSL